MQVERIWETGRRNARLFGAAWETSGASGNVKRATAVVTRYGCRRGEFFEGCNRAAGKLRRYARMDVSASIRGPKRRKRSEPLAGCEAQQTHGLLAEEAAEVVRNHEGGTGLSDWIPMAEAGSLGLVGVDASEESSAERRSESHERRSPRGDRPGRRTL
jgi:hypothetical protein